MYLRVPNCLMILMGGLTFNTEHLDLYNSGVLINRDTTGELGSSMTWESKHVGYVSIVESSIGSAEYVGKYGWLTFCTRNL